MRPLLLLAALCLLPALARADAPAPTFFVGAGAFTLDRASAFDRKTPGVGRGPGFFVQAGVQAKLLVDADAAVLVARAVDVNDDGADIDFWLGELRIPIGGRTGERLSVGGGRITGAGRKSSWVETLAYARDIHRNAYVELRGIFDEGDGRLATLGVGWRF